MRFQAAAKSIAPFLSIFVSGFPFMVKAESNTLTVTEGDILFDVVLRAGDEVEPYKITFTEDSVQSVYEFKLDGCVTNIKVGSEKYEPVYDSSADLIGVVRTARRNLVGKYEAPAEDIGEGAVFGSRRLFACDDCVATWDAVCDEGVPCVCNLLDFKSELSLAAMKSFETMCETFGSGACSRSGGPETCAGQCKEDGASVEPTPAPTQVSGTSYTETETSSTETETSSTGTGVTSCLVIDTDPKNGDSGCYLNSDEELFLYGCDLTDSDMEGIGACFDSIGRSNIRRVHLNDNALTSLSEDLFSGSWTLLERVNVGSNRLTSIPAGVFSTLTSVTHLDLYDNVLASLSEEAFSGLKSLTELNLGDNLLQTLPEGLLSGLASLEYLDFTRNRLASLPAEIFSGLTSLDYLSFYQNNLETLPDGVFSGLTSLKVLVFEENTLTTLPTGIFAGLTLLNYLDLDSTGLEYLEADVFSGLTLLDDLDLEGNKLTTLPPGIFSGMTKLRDLGLGDNDITTLPEGVFSDMESVTFLFMDENILQCQPPAPSSSGFVYNNPRSGTCDCPADFPDICGPGVACSSGDEGYVCG